MRIAGVDIGGTSIKVGIFDGDVLIRKDSRRTPFGNPDAVCDLIAGMLRGQNVQLVGVGTAGSVEFRTGTVSAGNLGWVRVPLRHMLARRLGVPVWVDNDAQAAIMAEWHNGSCAGAVCAVYLTLGTGIGGAMIIGGKPYRGKNNLGAEFGHMITHPDGPRCSCGRHGCLEYYASATALRRMSGGRSCRAVIDAAKAGDRAMLDTFSTFVRELCIGLNTLIMAFDPEYIVLGGGGGCGAAGERRAGRRSERRGRLPCRRLPAGAGAHILGDDRPALLPRAHRPPSERRRHPWRCAAGARKPVLVPARRPLYE